MFIPTIIKLEGSNIGRQIIYVFGTQYKQYQY